MSILLAVAAVSTYESITPSMCNTTKIGNIVSHLVTRLAKKIIN